MKSLALALLSSAVLIAAARAETQAGDPLDGYVRAPRIAIGPLVLTGEDHPAPDLADFSVSVESSKLGAEARWIEKSVRWVRAKDGLPVPRARLRISVKAAPERLILRWRGRAVQFQGGADEASTEIFVPLLDGGEARLEADGKPDSRIKITARPASSSAPGTRHAVDHTCSAYRIQVAGLDDAYLSMSCRMIPVNRLGSEESLLEVRWAAAGVTLPDGSAPPLTADLRDGRPARTTLIGPDGKSRVVELSASVPPRFNRMRLAWGAGPYNLSSSAGSGNGPGGSVMLYGNFRLRTEDNLSVRAFEAAVGQSPHNTAFFNNLGLYFAYDAVRAMDERLRLTILLGAQIVTFAPRGLASAAYNEMIAPQGFEVSYPDAFGYRNKTLSGGLFLQPGITKRYQNMWVRYGGRWFGELNYLSWRANTRYATMWGFSVGAPLAQFF
jgi:hypothetical protein